MSGNNVVETANDAGDKQDLQTSSQASEKEMATHSSILAWRIPGTGEPGGLSSMGSAQSRT